MKLKALTIGLALSFPLLASAQSDTSVTLYGVIDTAIEYVSGVASPDRSPGAAPGSYVKHSSTHFTNLTSYWTSYWGLRGTEKISDNLSAVFTLESGFNPGTGTSLQGDRLFGRQSYVGLTGDWGQVAFGRQYNMLMRASLAADFLGPNAYGLSTLDSYIPNTRMDNSITYMGNFSGIKLGLAYSRGRDTVNTVPQTPASTNCGVDYTNQTGCSAYSAMLGYDSSNWGVAAAYDVITGTGNRVGTLPVGNYYDLADGQKDRRIMANGYFKVTPDLKFSVIYLNRKTDAQQGIISGSNQGTNTGSGSLGDRSDLWSINAAYNVTPAVTLDGSVNYIKFNNAVNTSSAWYYVARAKYSLSKRTSVYASAAYIKNKGDSAISAAGGTAGRGFGVEPGKGQTAVMAGLRHSF
ncbi:porin [Eoetvoesiella caeni]|uniref:Putative porin n=1 Tax=Eoetvoesiella caeni TaxID=645616 RepID=A0A366HJA7_9BURK|nr:porin [Eoetvoesiella caeni]MCI2807564.1 porin [Eoetvoesiella caeni]NYT53041.1 porin [Eoetvoesiella caeni]RBP43018.1 putative porin [Eoetvoesiella caeni]